MQRLLLLTSPENANYLAKLIFCLGTLPMDRYAD